MRPSIDAVHEAGHAVAHAAFGLPFRGVRVHRRKAGSGINYGTGREIRLFNLPDVTLWARVVGLLAGGFVEARYRRCDATYIFLTTASEDWRIVEQHRTALALRFIPTVMYATGVTSLGAEEVEECGAVAVHLAEEFTREFVRAQWPIILKVAATLDAVGFLSAPDVREMVEMGAA